jgi:hypothetical protein
MPNFDLSTPFPAGVAGSGDFHSCPSQFSK